MIPTMLLAAGIQQMWYALPLMVAVSLVYAATRHEHLRPILQHAARFGGMVVLFMVVVLLLLMLLSLAV